MKNDRFRKDINLKHKKIEPVFNRDGFYKMGSNTWYEVDGQAWTYEGDRFDYELVLLNTELLRETEVEVLTNLITTFPNTKGIDVKEISHILYKDKEVKELREIPRRMKKNMIKARKKALVQKYK